MQQADALQSGQVLAGKYRVEQVIGRGGMGLVVSATHLMLKQKVALKFLLPEVAQSPEIVARFLREAQAAATIRGDHVARVMDVGTLEDGTAYMVMEFLEGSDLSHLLARLGPLSVPTAVDYVLQACEALAEAHAAGIVHRDLKPANLFVTKDFDGSAFVKVLDFGISKAAATGEGGALTQENRLIGSPYYMSPEQMRSSRDVDSRTDIWALGIIMFELLTGKVPFGGNSIVEICTSVVSGQLPSLASVRPDLPPQLVRIVEGCLRADPAQRIPSVAVLARALVEFAPPHAREAAARIIRAGGGSSATVTLEKAPNAGMPAMATGTAWGQATGTPARLAPAVPAPERPKSSRWGGVAVGGALLACAAVGAMFWMRSRPVIAPPPPVVAAEARAVATSAPPASSPEAPPLAVSATPTPAAPVASPAPLEGPASVPPTNSGEVSVASKNKRSSVHAVVPPAAPAKVAPAPAPSPVAAPTNNSPPKNNSSLKIEFQ